MSDPHQFEIHDLLPLVKIGASEPVAGSKLKSNGVPGTQKPGWLRFSMYSMVGFARDPLKARPRRAFLAQVPQKPCWQQIF
jgi:hypothetical protein